MTRGRSDHSIYLFNEGRKKQRRRTEKNKKQIEETREADLISEETTRYAENERSILKNTDRFE
jgi:hypothetical protein